MPNTLTAAQIAKLTTPGIFRVDRGLYLQLRVNGARSWLVRFQLRGRRRSMGIGPIRLVPLTEARARALKAQRVILDGIDPIEVRRASRPAAPAETAPNFATCSGAYIKAHRDAWSNAKHVEQWQRTLETYAGPTIGALPVSEITVDHIRQVLEPIWVTKSETAGRVRGRIEKVLGWAEAVGHRSGPNPASWRGPLAHMLPALSKVQKIEHYAAMPYVEVPSTLRGIIDRPGVAARALAFVILTVSRSGEVRGMRWRELDRASKTWTVPPERMKTRKVHRVPLSEGALALLPAVDGAPDDFVFPGLKVGKSLSDMTLLKLIRAVRGDATTVHGARSSFRDWSAERTDVAKEIVEACLAHSTGNDVELAYLRTDFLEKRRDLLAAWSSYALPA